MNAVSYTVRKQLVSLCVQAMETLFGHLVSFVGQTLHNV